MTSKEREACLDTHIDTQAMEETVSNNLQKIAKQSGHDSGRTHSHALRFTQFWRSLDLLLTGTSRIWMCGNNETMWL